MNKKIRQLAKPVVTQFKQMFSRFCNGDAKHVSYGDWSCGRGGYDKWFEIYFSGTAVCDCVSGECNWFGDTKEIGLTDTDLQTIKKYIIDHYGCQWSWVRFVD